MGQTSYSPTIDPALAGQLADGIGEAEIRSFTNEEASAAIPFGVAVKQGSAAGLAKLLSAATDKIVGINAHNHAFDNIGSPDGIKAKGTLGVMRDGAVYVRAEVAVAVGDEVFVRHTSDGGSNVTPGTFRNDADNGKAVHLKGAEFRTAGAPGDLVIVDLEPTDARDDHVALVFDHAQVTGTTTKKEFKTRSDRYLVVEKIRYINPTGLVTDATNYFDVELKNGSTSLAKGTTLTGGDPAAFAADTHLDLTPNATAANLVLPPNTEITSVLTLHGTQTLPAGRFELLGRYL